MSDADDARLAKVLARKKAETESANEAAAAAQRVREAEQAHAAAVEKTAPECDARMLSALQRMNKKINDQGLTIAFNRRSQTAGNELKAEVFEVEGGTSRPAFQYSIFKSGQVRITRSKAETRRSTKQPQLSAPRRINSGKTKSVELTGTVEDVTEDLFYTAFLHMLEIAMA